MELGFPDDGTAPTSETRRRAYDLLSEGFGPGFNGPLLLAVEIDDPAALQGLDQLTSAIAATEGVAAVTPPQPNEAGDAAIIQVIPTTSPQDHATTELVRRLRVDTIPAATPEGAVVHVGGGTATFIDLSDRITNALPWFIGAVVLLSFLLLMVVFRSILVPLKAAVLNLLSIGAAYGVIVAIFQWGWGRSLLGIDQLIPIVSFVPMMMFAVLFGLSMDYEVFLLSRIREEYLKTGKNVESVVSGISTTARVITSAALIMIAVFLSFVTQPDPIAKMFGIGLAVAVFIDATIVRIVLVPATMVLLGDANWWLPGWLDRILPKMSLEFAEDPEASRSWCRSDSWPPRSREVAPMDTDVARVAGWVEAAEHIAVLTGAGISTESGIPDFRGPNGLWTKNPTAMRLSNIEDYVRDPQVRADAWQERLRHPAWTAEPNAGHRALADLEQRGKLLALMTQNIDGLHQAAGSERVLELHGTNPRGDVPVVRPADPDAGPARPRPRRRPRPGLRGVRWDR